MVLIKVADISNEARPLDIAEPWLECLMQVSTAMQGPRFGQWRIYLVYAYLLAFIVKVKAASLLPYT